MQAVATDGLEIRQARQIMAYSHHTVMVVAVVDWIRFLHAHHRTILHFAGMNQADTRTLVDAHLDQALLWPVPFLILVPQKILQSQRGPRWIWHHVWTPVLVILDAPHLHFRGMDIDPVIGKDRCSLHHQHHGEIISVAEAICRPEDFGWGRRLKGLNEIIEWHRRDKVLTFILNPLPC